MGALTKLTRDKFIPFLDTSEDSTFVGNTWKRIDLSTIFITHDIDEAILLSDRIYILNGKPGEIRDEIIIKEKKPRAEDFYLTDEFLAYKREIIAKL